MSDMITAEAAQKLLDEAEAMRNAVAGIETNGYFHASNWADKPHRLVFDGARNMENLARTVIALHARLAAAEAQVRALREALRKHHEWHLSQDRDGAAWGIDPVDAYSGSGLCEETVAALASGDGAAK